MQKSNAEENSNLNFVPENHLDGAKIAEAKFALYIACHSAILNIDYLVPICKTSFKENVAENWDSVKKWVDNDGPNVKYLDKQYGHSEVIIYNCSERYFNTQKCEESVLSQYTKYWHNKHNISNLYYLKDWHLKRQYKNDEFYQVPIYFASDWLNEYYTNCLNDDYRFVYMGPKSTWTPLHLDVFSSYSWSVNICGQKRWIFLPPGEESYLKDSLNNLPYTLSQVPSKIKCFDVIQNPGDAIFVPSGWYHQVWNIKDTISINHNWVNGCNIYTMWDSLKENLERIKHEIDDCKDMENFLDHCQIILHAHFGMNFKKFYQFVRFIVKSRLNGINNGFKSGPLFHGHTPGKNHVIFDLKQIQKVLENFLSNRDVKETQYLKDGHLLLVDIVQSLKNV